MLQEIVEILDEELGTLSVRYRRWRGGLWAMVDNCDDVENLGKRVKWVRELIPGDYVIRIENNDEKQQWNVNVTV